LYGFRKIDILWNIGIICFIIELHEFTSGSPYIPQIWKIDRSLYLRASFRFLTIIILFVNFHVFFFYTYDLTSAKISIFWAHLAKGNDRPIRNKNHLWWPCLLIDWERMSNLYRGPSIDGSYQVAVHLVEGYKDC
jgi:hypothetical protein